MSERAIEVRIVGDPSDLERALGRGANALKAFGGDVEKAAAAQVEAGVKQREELTRLARQYEIVAGAAKKGSDEQIVAAAKAAEANQKLAVKSKAAAEESAIGFNRATSAGAGFLKTTLAFGAGFAGFEGLKASIHTVLEAQTSIHLLDQAVKNAHGSVKALTPILEEHAAKSRALGFDDDQTREAEARLVTAFGATKKALGELSDAQDLARTRHEDLATAAQQLILLQEGNTRAAKQFGLALPDLTKKQWDAKAAADGLTISQERGKVLYDELLPRIHAQAQAFANSPSGKIAEFQAQIQHLEESIGEGLLPEVNHYLTAVDNWLAKGDNQKRITDDINKAIHTLAGVLHDAETAIQDVLPYVNDVAHALGGWKTVIEELVALKFAVTVAGWAGAIGKASTAIGTAASEAGGLRLALLSLGGADVIAAIVAAAAAYAAFQQANKSVAGDQPIYAKYHGKVYAAAAGSRLGDVLTTIASGDKPTNKELADLDKGIAGGNVRVYPTVAAAKADGAISPTTPASSALRDTSFVNPIPVGSFARIDQGTDYVANSAVRAIGSGKIISVAGGMAGGTGTIIKEQLAHPVHINGRTYKYVYYSEQKSLVKKGDVVKAGASVMGAGGNELGFLDDSGHMAPLVGGLGAGTKPTAMGRDFADFVASLGGPAGSAYGPPPPSAGDGSTHQTKPRKTPVTGGDNLLPEALRNAITDAQNNATGSQGTVAAHWLRLELADLERAHTVLEGQLKGATGKQKATIEQELRSVSTRIAGVNKSITTNLKAQSQAIKSAFSSTLSSEKSAISSAASQLKSELDAQFQQATQTYIDSVLGPKYFQGTDTHGVGLQTPEEQTLAAFSSAQAAKQRSDQLAQDQKQYELDKQTADVTAEKLAQDQKAIQVDEDAITQAELEAKATASRAQADHDYADAVKTYQTERSTLERQLNDQLDRWAKGLDDGTTKLSDLSGLVAGFGLTLADPSTGVAADLSVLSSAVVALATTMLDEAAKLSGAGDAASARNVWQAAGALGVLSAGGGVTAGLGGADGFFLLNQISKMADGGDILSDGLVYVHAGERVQPASVVRGDTSGSGGETHIHFHGGTFIGSRAEQVARELKPHIERIVSSSR